MKKSMDTLFFMVLLSVFLLSFSVTTQNKTELKTHVKVGLVLDYNTSIGRMGQNCIRMAVSEFYKSHGHYNTRLELIPRDSKFDVIGAASAALDLIKNEKVQAIIGPITSAQANMVVEFGEKSHVPIISFSATSPFLSHRSSYFFRATQNESSQAKAITAIVQAFGWKQVVPIYSSEGLIPSLTDTLLDAFVAHVPHRCVIAPSVTTDGLRAELLRLMTMQTRVFVHHITDPSLGKRVFAVAKEIGMMGEGYVWIMTNVMTDLLSASPDNHTDLNGVLGIKTYIPATKEVEGFRGRYRKRKFRDEEVNIFGIQAYDAATTLVRAVEEVWDSNSSVKFGIEGDNYVFGNHSTDLDSVRVSENGPKLRHALSNVSFEGLMRNFSFVDGELHVPTYEIINVVNGKTNNVIGFWTPNNGLLKGLNSSEIGKAFYNTSKDNLGLITWPGNSTLVPKGWEIPVHGKRLRVGVPVRSGFKELVNVKFNSDKKAEFDGYCIDIFRAVIDKLPYKVEFDFIAYGDSSYRSSISYDEMVYQVFAKKFDVVVGDVTIRYNRSKYVDFTLPYMESGVSMIVPLEKKEKKNAWVFTKPLTWDLWLTSALFFIFIGSVVWVLEHRINEEFRGPPSYQIGTTFWFGLSTMVFAHRERVISNLARIVLIIWVFVVVILTQSYTASLTSFLTVQWLQPTVTNITELIRNNEPVGYFAGSFTHGLLVSLGFHNSQLKTYDSTEKLHEAFLNYGYSPNGIAAAFDESPNINLFLRLHCNKYTMVGPKYKADGFGFVFPMGSPLVLDVSRQILNVTEDGELIKRLEMKHFGDKQYCTDTNPQLSADQLGLESFWGLFLVAGMAAIFALAIHAVVFFHGHWETITSSSMSDASILEKIRIMWGLFDKKDSSSHAFGKNRQTADTQSNCSSVRNVVTEISQTDIALDPNVSPTAEERKLDDQALSHAHFVRVQSSEPCRIENDR